MTSSTIRAAGHGDTRRRPGRGWRRTRGARGRAPEDAASRAHLHELLRSFFGPLLTPGPRRIAADEGLGARDVIRDKRAILGLRLPGRMLFLFCLRFGLYAVLSRLQAEVD